MAGPKKNKQTKSEPVDSALVDAIKRFNDSWQYAEDNWHDKWDRDNKLYDNERVNATYKGQTDTFVPMVFSTIETMVSALNNANIRFDYKSGDPMKRVDAKPLNALVDEYWDDDAWDLKLEEGFRETLTTGMAAFMLSWDIDHPHLEPFAMRDAVIDPTVRNPEELQREGAYAGRRYYVRKGTLEGYQVVDTDPESKTFGELIPRFKLDGNKTVLEGQEKPDDKALKEMFGSSTLKNAKDDQDELIEIWDINRVVTVRNRSEVIEDVDNPYKQRHEMQLRKRFSDELAAKLEGGAFTDQEGVTDTEAYEKAIKDVETRAKAEAKGIVPFFFLRNYRKLSLFYASSEIQPIAKEQELLNDMTNMESDYIIRQLAPQKELDPEYEDWLDLIDNDPDTVYPFKPGSLVDRPVPVLPANSFNNRMNIKNEIRETTAIDQVAKGAANVKDTTATEVRAQLSQTGQRIESKARIFEKDGLYWFGWILLKEIQLYVDKPLVVEVPGANVDKDEILARYKIELPEGAAIFDPTDYSDDWRPRISLEVDAQNKQIDEARSARESYAMLIQDPTNNLEEAKKRLYPKMFNIDKSDLQAIMTPAVEPVVSTDVAGGTIDPAALGGEVAPEAVEVPGVI